MNRIIKLTDHFALHEFACHCKSVYSGCAGAVIVPPTEFLDMLEHFRNNHGRVVINSGYRCYYWNTHVGGKPASYHTMVDKRFEKYGASDIDPVDLKSMFGAQWIDIALTFIRQEGIFSGIIAHKRNGDLNKSFLHVDLRPNSYFKEEEW